MQQPWSFIAMEYYAIMLNRTYFLRVDDQKIVGSVCRGLTSVVGGGDPITREITSRLAIHGNLADPATYVDEATLSRRHRANFSISLSKIRSVTYDPRKKWGMGYYPHDGRVIIVSQEQRREFIVLGEQSGSNIASRLRSSVERANSSFKPPPFRGVA